MSYVLVQKKESAPAKVQFLATLLALAAAVALPQAFHWIGKVSGSGTAPGIAFCPMHLPILIVGFLAGPLFRFLYTAAKIALNKKNAFRLEGVFS